MPLFPLLQHRAILEMMYKDDGISMQLSSRKRKQERCHSDLLMGEQNYTTVKQTALYGSASSLGLDKGDSWATKGQLSPLINGL